MATKNVKIEFEFAIVGGIIGLIGGIMTACILTPYVSIPLFVIIGVGTGIVFSKLYNKR